MLNSAVLLAALASTASAQQPSPRATVLELQAVRFWAPQQGQTRVLAMVGVPYTLLSSVGTGAEAHLAYTVTIKVTDDRGTVLTTEDFRRSAPAEARRDGVVGVEQLNFGLMPGKYMLSVTVTDSLGGKRTTDSLALEGFAASPGASDILLASGLRLTPENDTTTAAGEISHGARLRLITAPLVRIDITRPNLGYVVEAYSASQTTGTLRLSIKAPDGGAIVDLPALTQKVEAGGAVLRGMIPLEGLPEGNYVLHASLTIDGRKIDRSQAFAVSESKEALQRSLAMAAANRGTDEGYFGSLTQDSLDAAYDVLSMAGASSRDLALYKKDQMSIEAKRKFLIDFWAQRDANKATPENETRMLFYERVAFANSAFGERGRVGWKTDRGRVYSKFGKASEVTRYPSQNKAPPFELWRYQTGTPKWFIFADRGNIGAYNLIRSNELTERGVANWIELLLEWGVDDEIARWLGVVNLESVR